MTDLLEKLDMSTESISQNMFYTLFNGGSLKSGGLDDLSFKRLIREYCPALSLLGSAYGNQMTEGKLKTGILRPVCFEMNEYNRNQTELSLYSGMLSDVFHTRMDRLKKSVEEVSDSDFNTKKQAVQMKYEMENLKIFRIRWNCQRMRSAERRWKKRTSVEDSQSCPGMKKVYRDLYIPPIPEWE